jgi:hypothetical protein
MDPSYYPARQVPLSDDPEEYGVTARKLLPRMQYHAFVVDPVTGDKVPARQPAQKVLIVHNLPANATPDFVGRFFETFDMIVECDIMKTAANPPHHPQCKGRAYVVFQDPKTVDYLLENYKTISFYGTVVFLDWSDRVPKPSVVPPPMYQHSAQGPDGATPHVQTPTAQLPQHNGVHHHSLNVGFIDPRLQTLQDQRRTAQHGGVSIPSAPAAVATAEHNYYFVTHIYEEHIPTSTRDGIFWPTKATQRTFYAALERGPVFLLFLVVQREALFGYARLTPRDMVRNKHANFTLDWIKHSVYLSEEDLRPLGVPVLGFVDGTSLKPDLGQQICEFVDGFPSRKCPESIPYLQPVSQNQGSRVVPQARPQPPPAPAQQQRALPGASMPHGSVLPHHQFQHHHQGMLAPPAAVRSPAGAMAGPPAQRPFHAVEQKKPPPPPTRWRPSIDAEA